MHWCCKDTTRTSAHLLSSFFFVAVVLFLSPCVLFVHCSIPTVSSSALRWIVSDIFMSRFHFTLPVFSTGEPIEQRCIFTTTLVDLLTYSYLKTVLFNSLKPSNQSQTFPYSLIWILHFLSIINFTNRSCNICRQNNKKKTFGEL